MRPAEARLSASATVSSSIRLSLVGAQVDCKINTSRPRTFSKSSTAISPSENLPTEARPREMPRCLTTFSAKPTLALPANTIKLSYAISSLPVLFAVSPPTVGNIAAPSRLGLTGLQTVNYTPSAGKTKVLFERRIRRLCRPDVGIGQRMPARGLPQSPIKQSNPDKRGFTARKFLPLQFPCRFCFG